MGCVIIIIIIIILIHLKRRVWVQFRYRSIGIRTFSFCFILQPLVSSSFFSLFPNLYLCSLYYHSSLYTWSETFLWGVSSCPKPCCSWTSQSILSPACSHSRSLFEEIPEKVLINYFICRSINYFDQNCDKNENRGSKCVVVEKKGRHNGWTCFRGSRSEHKIEGSCNFSGSWFREEVR